MEGKDMRTRLQRQVGVGALATFVLAGVALVIPVAGAQATPSLCHSMYWEGTANQTGWQATCDKLTNPPHDEWRAVAYCVRDSNSNVRVTVYGPWVGGIRAWSIAHCAANYSPWNGWYETRVNYP
jgi:hypothetical protein